MITGGGVKKDQMSDLSYTGDSRITKKRNTGRRETLVRQ